MLYRLSKIMFAAAALAAFLGATPAAADEITVRQAWSRATPKGAKVACVLSGGNVNLDQLRGLRWN